MDTIGGPSDLTENIMKYLGSDVEDVIPSSPPRTIVPPVRDESTNTIDALENTLHLLREELESLRKQQLSDASRFNAEYESKLAIERARHQKELGHFRSQNEQLNHTIQQLRQESESKVELELSKNHQEICVLKEDNQKLNLALQQLKDDFDLALHTHREKDNLEITQLEEEVEETQSNVSKLQNELLAKKTQIESLEEENNILRNQCTVANDESEDLQKERDELKAELDQNEKLLAKQKSEAGISSVQLINDRTKALQKECYDTQKKLETLAISWEKKDKDLVLAKKKLQDQHVKHREELEKQSQWVDEMTISHSQKIKSLERDLELVRKESVDRGKLLMRELGKNECGKAVSGKQPYIYQNF